MATLELPSDDEIDRLTKLESLSLDQIAWQILPTELLRLIRHMNSIKSLGDKRGPLFSFPDKHAATRRYEAERALRDAFGLRCRFDTRSSDMADLIACEGDLVVVDHRRFRSWLIAMRSMTTSDAGHKP